MQNRPSLVIECTGGRNLGRCYNATYYKVTSKYRLSRERLGKLFNAGFLGCGQSFSITSQCDGTEKCAGTDTIKYAQDPQGRTYESEYFEYTTECRCDSSD